MAPGRCRLLYTRRFGATCTIRRPLSPRCSLTHAADTSGPGFLPAPGPAAGEPTRARGFGMVVVTIADGTAHRLVQPRRNSPATGTREMLPLMQNNRGNLAEPRQSPLVELRLEWPPNARSREPRGDDPQLSWWDLIEEGTTIDEGATPLDQSVLAQQLELPADRRAAQTDFARDRRRTKRSNGEQGDDASTRWVGQEFDPACGALRHRVMIAIGTSRPLNRRFARYFRLSGSIAGVVLDETVSCGPVDSDQCRSLSL